MIKNIILDVGKVLVEWDTEYAFREMGLDGEIGRAVAAATVASPDWNELDRSLLTDEEILAKFIANAPEYEKEIRMVWDNIALPIWQYDYARPWILAMKRNGYRVYILSNYSRYTYRAYRGGAVLSGGRGRRALFLSGKADQAGAGDLPVASCEIQLNPQECIFLDDRRENVEAAEAQGIAGIRFTGYEEALLELKRRGVKTD